jgi:hypothetical protein
MDQQQSEAVMSEMAAKVGDTVGDLTASTGKMVQDKIEQAKRVLRDLQERRGGHG